jgi:hypothetical protein
MADSQIQISVRVKPDLLHGATTRATPAQPDGRSGGAEDILEHGFEAAEVRSVPGRGAPRDRRSSRRASA